MIGSRPWRERTSDIAAGLALLVAGAVLGGVPVSALASVSGTAGGEGGLQVLAACLGSLALASSAALLTTAVAAPASWAFSRRRFLLGRPLLLLAAAAFCIPPAALLRMLLPLLDGTGAPAFIALLVVHLAWLLPVGVWLAYAVWRTLPEDVLEAARLDGLDESRLGRVLALPLRTRELGQVALALMALSVGEQALTLGVSHDSPVPTLVSLLAAPDGSGRQAAACLLALAACSLGAVSFPAVADTLSALAISGPLRRVRRTPVPRRPPPQP